MAVRMNVLRSRLHVSNWITHERLYGDTKYPIKSTHDQNMVESGIEWWLVFLTNYLSRAQTLGLDTPRGRQALGKVIVTAMDCLETACRVYGPMPQGGQPS